jgi:hypothetical protein
MGSPVAPFGSIALVPQTFTNFGHYQIPQLLQFWSYHSFQSLNRHFQLGLLMVKAYPPLPLLVLPAPTLDHSPNWCRRRRAGSNIPSNCVGALAKLIPIPNIRWPMTSSKSSFEFVFVRKERCKLFADNCNHSDSGEDQILQRSANPALFILLICTWLIVGNPS